MLQISYCQGIARTANPYEGFVPSDDRPTFSNTLRSWTSRKSPLFAAPLLFLATNGERGAERDGGLF